MPDSISSGKLTHWPDQFSLPNDLEVSVRIGIATGSVVVETIGEGTASENAIVGEAPNLAARLQGLAGENSIMIGPATHKLVESAFDFEDNGLRNIKGYDDRIATWEGSGAQFHR